METTGNPSKYGVQSKAQGFLKGNAELLAISARFFDLTIVTVAAISAHYLRFGVIELTSIYKMALLFGLFATATVFPLFDLYKPWRGMSIELEARTLLIAWLSVVVILPIAAYLTKSGADYSRLWYIHWVVITASLLILSRVLIRKTANWARSHGLNTRNIVIVGGGALGQRVSTNLAQNEWTGINVVGYIDDVKTDTEGAIQAPYLGETSRLLQVVSDQVWVALPLSEEEKIREVCSQLDDSAASVVFVPDIFMDGLLNHSVDNLAGMSVVNLRSSPIQGASSTLKMLEDIILSALALLLLALPMLLISIAIKLESKGPILFKQRRYGLDGKEIIVWKFRSMAVMEDGDSVVQAIKGDSRVTKVGSFIRRTSLDELPQFFNVLQGTMSIVGPRPHAVAHNEKYRKIVSRYMWRCKVKPGITGWAQVNGCRGETDTTGFVRQPTHIFPVVSKL